MQAGFRKGRPFDITLGGVGVRRRIGTGLGLGDVSTAGARDCVGEGEGADAAVQGPHLTAGA